MIRPGITGWAQINGGNLVTTEEKGALDTAAAVEFAGAIESMNRWSWK